MRSNISKMSSNKKLAILNT